MSGHADHYGTTEFDPRCELCQLARAFRPLDVPGYNSRGARLLREVTQRSGNEPIREQTEEETR